MNFSNLSPAERMKVSLLGGVIVIVLFFVAHTLLGALSPKKPANKQAKQDAKTSTSSASTTSAPGASAPVAVGAEGFTGVKLAQAGGKSKLGESPDLDMGTHDPFVPLQDTKPGPQAAPKLPAPAPDAARAAPDVSVKASHGFGGVGPSGMPPLPLLGAGPPGLGAAPAAVIPPPEPTIRVVGIVHGDPSVATIQVAERTMLARPGDALYTGYRLMQVGPESVVVRHKGERIPMRVGDMINEQKAKSGSTSQQ